MLMGNDRSLQADLVCVCWAVPVADIPASRDPCASAPIECAAPPLEIAIPRWPAQNPGQIRELIREMSIANSLWDAPRIHGELLKLGIDLGQTTVAKYMAKGRRPPSQGWKTFLLNHADGIASMDLFVVPTVSFRLLYGKIGGNSFGWG
jgi:hypothetical protein